MAENDDFFPEDTEKYNSDALNLSYSDDDHRIVDEDSTVYSIGSVDFANSVNNSDIRNIVDITDPTTSLMIAGTAILIIFSKGDNVFLLFMSFLMY